MEPKVYENSKVPVILSYLSPVTWINWLQGKPMFKIWAITFGPFVFVRGDVSEGTRRHETIHAYQYNETYIIGFLVLYIFDWIKGVIKYKDANKAYYRIRAEQEAYANDHDKKYFDKRVPKEWIKKYEV